MSETPLRVGLVGAGYIGGVHSAGWRAVGGTFTDLPRPVETTAVADSDAKRAEALRRSWGWGRAVGDWTAITRSDDIDVVDVCVPNSLHAEVVIDALEHGKHVVCEKPLAHNVESARAIVEAAARASDLTTQVCFYYRLWPAIAWANELISQGAIGDVEYFRGWMLQDYAAREDRDLGWRANRARAGAGALGDLGSHIFDVAVSLAGPITRLCATTHRFVGRTERGVDDAVSALVEFASGAGGVIEASWAMRGHKCDLGFDVVGRSGAIRFSWERSNEIELLSGDPDDPANGFKRVLVGGGQPDAGRFVAVAGQGLGYRDSFAIGLGRFAHGIAAGDPAPAPSVSDGLRVAELVDAALRSSDEGAWAVVRP